MQSQYNTKQGGHSTHRSGDTSLNSFLFSELTWARKDAVRTNWPTVLEKLQPAEHRSTVIERVDVPSKESVERKVGYEYAVDELHDAGEHEEDEEGVDEAQPVGGLLVVRFPEGKDGITGGSLCGLWRRL